MSDDGGSSGRLRRSRGLLPPGDVRNCLVALSGSRGALADVLQHRFGGPWLAGRARAGESPARRARRDARRLPRGHPLGLPAAGRPGTVLPSTLDAGAAGGRARGRPPPRRRAPPQPRWGPGSRRVFLHPCRPAPAEGVLEAIASADLVTLGPGSLYSSVLPNLLVDGVAEALQTTRARRVLVRESHDRARGDRGNGGGGPRPGGAGARRAGGGRGAAQLGPARRHPGASATPATGRSRCGPTSSASGPWGWFRWRRISLSAGAPASPRCPEAREGPALRDLGQGERVDVGGLTGADRASTEGWTGRGRRAHVLGDGEGEAVRPCAAHARMGAAPGIGAASHRAPVLGAVAVTGPTSAGARCTWRRGCWGSRDREVLVPAYHHGVEVDALLSRRRASGVLRVGRAGAWTSRIWRGASVPGRAGWCSRTSGGFPGRRASCGRSPTGTAWC